MFEQRLGRLTMLGLGLVITLMLALPVGVAAATPVGVGASTVFAGNGFTANESLSFWDAPSNDPSNITPLGGAQTDGTGGFTFTVSFPSAGQWTVTAHSIASGKEVTGSFAAGSGASTTTSPVTAPTSPTTTSGTAPSTSQAGVGAPVSFTGNGFTTNERISLWETAPDGKVTPLMGTQADGNGTFGVSVSFPSPGQWQVTAHGRDSAHEVIGRFVVTSDVPIATTTTSSTTPTSPGVTAPGTGAVTRTTTGTTISFMPTGFIGGEPVSVWSTGPDGTVTLLDAAQASSTGRAIITAAFATEGLWQLTAHGRDSGREVIGRYQVTARTTP